MPTSKIQTFLDDSGVPYETLAHAPTYTAQETAASAHIPGQELAKTVMIKVDGKMAMAVLPASRKLDVPHLRDFLGARNVELATEEEFRDFVPETELGAMPPFGNLYGLPVYADTSLEQDEQIAFNAGSHTELIRMRFEDFRKLVRPAMANVSRSFADS